MIYGQSLNVQYDNFLFSVGFGIIAGMIFNFYSVIIEVWGIKKTALIVCDILFALSLSVLCFIFFFCVNYGIIRFYLVIGIIIGIIIYYIGVGPHIFNGIKGFLNSLKASSKKIITHIIKNIKKLTKKT